MSISVPTPTRVRVRQVPCPQCHSPAGSLCRQGGSERPACHMPRVDLYVATVRAGGLPSALDLKRAQALPTSKVGADGKIRAERMLEHLVDAERYSSEDCPGWLRTIREDLGDAPQPSQTASEGLSPASGAFTHGAIDLPSQVN